MLEILTQNKSFQNIYITTNNPEHSFFFFTCFCELETKLNPYKFHVQLTPVTWNKTFKQNHVLSFIKLDSR